MGQNFMSGTVRGYRDPMTYRKSVGMIESMALTNHVLNIEGLVAGHYNVYLHQYVYELSKGLDPRESAWFIKAFGIACVK